MSTPQEVLLEKIKALEIELIAELQKQEEELFYEIRKKHIHFDENLCWQINSAFRRVGLLDHFKPFLCPLGVPHVRRYIGNIFGDVDAAGRHDPGTVF